MSQTDKIILLLIASIIASIVVLVLIFTAVDAIIIECVRSLCFHS